MFGQPREKCSGSRGNENKEARTGTNRALANDLSYVVQMVKDKAHARAIRWRQRHHKFAKCVWVSRSCGEC